MKIDFETKVPSLIQDPFTKNKIYWVRMDIHTGTNGWPRQAEATVFFQNGDTKGQQKVVEKDFPQLLTKLDALIKSLK